MILQDKYDIRTLSVNIKKMHMQEGFLVLKLVQIN